ncbi:MAG: FixH family protein [Boseongicola sp.]|nr:FixH family protein [Boseongicola sp.]NNL72366.1 FixH family protein [Silicimonas sp.]
MTTREITGRHVLIGTVAAFSVIVGVNVTLAVKAVGTFPGLEVKNSYVASQSFEARRAEQQALGWTVDTDVSDDVLTLRIADRNGSVVAPAVLEAVVGRPTIARDDRTLDLTLDNDVWSAPAVLGRGAWVLKLAAESADGTAFEQRIDIWVR